MMVNLNLELYQALFQEKKLTELFLGQSPFTWLYAVAEYSADCTVSVPFDLFDKTIVGILLLDEVLTIEQIGDILGLNIRDDADHQQYRDQAEYDILQMALDSLVDYSMIETGSNYEFCRLTRLGREYALRNRKLQSDQIRSFRLTYDLTSGNHNEAHKHFKGNDKIINLPHKASRLLPDAILHRTLAVVQIPELWDVEKGHFFKNEVLQQAQAFEMALEIAVLYDVETQMTRFLAYSRTHKKIYPFCGNWLGQQQSHQLLSELGKLNPVSNLLPFPEGLKQAFIQKKQAFERIFQEQPEKALAIASERYRNLEWIELPYFWNHIESFLPAEVEEIWLLLPDYTNELFEIIAKLERLNKPIFVMVQNQGEQKDVSAFFEKTLDLKSCLYMGTTEIQDLEVFMIGKNSKSFIINNLEINLNDNILSTLFLRPQSASKTVLNRKIAPIKNALATYYLSRMKQSLNDFATNYIKNSKKVSKSIILELDHLDQKATVFADLRDNPTILKQFAELKAVKIDFINALHEKNKNKGLKKIEEWFEDFKKQSFSKVEALYVITNDLQQIENELFDHYHELREKTAQAHQEIMRIKEEVLAKIYIIDTNIFIKEPDIINKIDKKHYIALSHTVINELDGLKKNPDCEVNASKVIQMLNKQLNKNKRLETYKADLNAMDTDYQQPTPDNKILSVANRLRDRNAVLLTNDNGLQLKAKSIGIPVISLMELLVGNGNEEKQSTLLEDKSPVQPLKSNEKTDSNNKTSSLKFPEKFFSNNKTNYSKKKR
jgi:rRNA-processing protein FCF1